MKGCKYQIFKDIYGKLWITAEGIRRYFNRIVPPYYFYDYYAIASD